MWKRFFTTIFGGAERIFLDIQGLNAGLDPGFFIRSRCLHNAKLLKITRRTYSENEYVSLSFSSTI